MRSGPLHPQTHPLTPRDGRRTGPVGRCLRPSTSQAKLRGIGRPLIYLGAMLLWRIWFTCHVPLWRATGDKQGAPQPLRRAGPAPPGVGNGGAWGWHMAEGDLGHDGWRRQEGGPGRRNRSSKGGVCAATIVTRLENGQPGWERGGGGLRGQATARLGREGLESQADGQGGHSDGCRRPDLKEARSGGGSAHLSTESPRLASWDTVPGSTLLLSSPPALTLTSPGLSLGSPLAQIQARTES